MASVALADAVKGKLKPEDLAGLKKTRWLDRLTSLWAPISIFGIAFTVYLVIVEFSVCAYPPLQPWLQGFGLIMLAYYFALVGMRVVARRFMQARKARHIAEELVAEVEELATKNASALGPKPTDELAERLVATVRAIASRDAKAAKDATVALAESADKHLKKFKRGSSADFAGGFMKALLVALLIRSVLVEPFKIPSGSMIPTLEIGDQIFVNKFIYGVRVPFMNKVPFTIVREPKKGDVVVFDNRLVGKDFIKRVVGVPGDHLEIQGTQVKINGELLPTRIENPDNETWEMPNCPNGFFECIPTWFRNDWHPVRSALSREELGDRPHYILNRGFPSGTPIDVVVPPRSVFVMGDNRENSSDSRFGLGCAEAGTCPPSGPGPTFVPYDDIKGKATVVWLSLSHEGLFASLFGGTGIRGDRFFRSVTMCGNEPAR